MSHSSCRCPGPAGRQKREAGRTPQLGVQPLAVEGVRPDHQRTELGQRAFAHHAVAGVAAVHTPRRPRRCARASGAPARCAGAAGAPTDRHRQRGAAASAGHPAHRTQSVRAAALPLPARIRRGRPRGPSSSSPWRNSCHTRAVRRGFHRGLPGANRERAASHRRHPPEEVPPFPNEPISPVGAVTFRVEAGPLRAPLCAARRARNGRDEVDAARSAAPGAAVRSLAHLRPPVAVGDARHRAQRLQRQACLLLLHRMRVHPGDGGCVPPAPEMTVTCCAGNSDRVWANGS